MNTFLIHILLGGIIILLVKPVGSEPCACRYKIYDIKPFSLLVRKAFSLK